MSPKKKIFFLMLFVCVGTYVLDAGMSKRQRLAIARRKQARKAVKLDEQPVILEEPPALEEPQNYSPAASEGQKFEPISEMYAWGFRHYLKYKAHGRTSSEMAAYLNVPEPFVNFCLSVPPNEDIMLSAYWRSVVESVCTDFSAEELPQKTADNLGAKYGIDPQEVVATWMALKAEKAPPPPVEEPVVMEEPIVFADVADNSGVDERAALSSKPGNADDDLYVPSDDDTETDGDTEVESDHENAAILDLSSAGRNDEKRHATSRRKRIVVKNYLNELSPAVKKEILRIRHDEGRSIAVIAKRLNCSFTAVQSIANSSGMARQEQAKEVQSARENDFIIAALRKNVERKAQNLPLKTEQEIACEANVHFYPSGEKKITVGRVNLLKAHLESAARANRNK